MASDLCSRLLTNDACNYYKSSLGVNYLATLTKKHSLAPSNGTETELSLENVGGEYEMLYNASILQIARLDFPSAFEYFEKVHKLDHIQDESSDEIELLGTYLQIFLAHSNSKDVSSLSDQFYKSVSKRYLTLV